MKKHTFSVGDLSEGDPWEIVEGDDCEFYSSPRCSHAIAIDETDFRIPRYVRAVNEGGCASTYVCLDCILDAAKSLGFLNENKD